jgi:putative peptidoglycan lipid II flippase
MSLLLQKAVLPLFPEMHAGHGLLMNDAIVFHKMAVEIAQKIQVLGWSEWRIYPHGASANVSLISALYALLGPDPGWFIPFNAAAHATGSLLIYRIGACLVDGDIGKFGGLFAGIFFLISPSALQWYGQNHKDAFVIAGSLFALEVWLVLQDQRFQIKFRGVLKVFIATLLAAILVGIFRPYYVLVISIAFAVSFLATFWWGSNLKQILIRLIFIFLMGALGLIFARVELAVGVYKEGGTQNVGAYSSYNPEQFKWEESKEVPVILDRTLQRASELRAHFLSYGRSVGAGSEIDGNRLPNSTWEALAYLPRALIVGLFAPFPHSWGERVSLPRLIGAIETACWYLVFIGSVVAILRHKNRKLLAGVVFCAVLVTVLAYVHPNVGTLYRQRFAFWHFFMLVGCIGWVSLVQLGSQNLILQSSLNNRSEFIKNNTVITSNSDRVVESGVIVMLITLLCYLGFFTRDLLLTGRLGLGSELDAFFSAITLPMVFVTCLAMPMGDAMLLPFIRSDNGLSKERERLLQGTMGLTVLILTATMFVVLASAPWLVNLVLQNSDQNTKILATNILRWFTPIIGLSAWTIIGNAALNALGKFRVTAAGQLVVPITALLAIILSPNSYIVTVSILSMLIGALINAIVVFWHLRKCGLILLPVNNFITSTAEVRRIYWPLVAATILPAALVPLNYAFASDLPPGTVAAWAFASKFVILFTGLTSAIATSIVLPQIARRLELLNAEARQDANRMIAMGLWFGGVLMFFGFLFAEPLMAILLGNHLSLLEITYLGDIVKIGMMQLPVAIVGILVNKFAITVGYTSRVMVASIFGFIGNLAINLVLVPQVGGVGVAIGALVGVTFPVIIILAGVHRQIGLSSMQVIIVLAIWLAWIMVCISLITTSVTAFIISITTLGIMARLHLTSFRG